MDTSCTTEDIEALVTKWYFQRKQKVPEEDKVWLRAYKEQEAGAEKILWKEPLPDGVQLFAAPPDAPKEKPAYGTKEFWKDWWARKKEKERIAAAGVVGDPKGSATNPEPEPEKKKRLLQNRRNQQQSKKAVVVVPAAVTDPGVEAITAGLSTMTLAAPVVAEPKKIKLVRKKVVVDGAV